MTRNIIRSIIGASLLAVGILAVGAGSALAAGSSQNTTLSVVIPATISLTGLNANYSGTGPAGTQVNINTGPITVSTNNPTGYKLVLTAAGANFVGINPANTIPVSNDNVATCDAAFITCVPLNVGPSGATIKNTGAASTDTFGVQHQVAVPAAKVPDTYSLVVTYTATTNP